MIYCGVQLYPGSFKIVALSDAFALIDEQFFHIDNHCKLTPWINSLKAEPLEEIQWFFDDGEFNNNQYTAQLFFHLAHDDDILLVNHRKLINIIQFFYEWMAQEEIFHIMPTKAFVLASAPRIFSGQELIPFYPDDVAV